MSPRSTPPPLPKVVPDHGTLPNTVRQPRGSSILKRAVAGLAVMLTVTLGSAWLLHVSIDPADEIPAFATRTDARTALAAVNQWGYQLQRLDIKEAERSPLDLLVVDETVDGSRTMRDLTSNLVRLKRKPDGNRRLVISYLSIGEAEDYRGYWQTSWVKPDATPSQPEKVAYFPSFGASPARAHVKFAAPPGLRPQHVNTSVAPSWLDRENPEWRGNYRVRFWQQEWQKLLFGDKAAALDRLLEAGFDGVYLDRADVYGQWLGERPSAMNDMIKLVSDIATYARRKKPGFLVIMQNAEELLSTQPLRNRLDAVAKEDLLYGVDGTTKANHPGEITASLQYLQMARRDGLPILVVEYLDDRTKVEDARRRIKAEGFIPYFGPRALNALGGAG
ncbi:MAG: endo alpha-1,4 polygalactosaminidase [Hyphomicrobiaceae bacterium]